MEQNSGNVNSNRYEYTYSRDDSHSIRKTDDRPYADVQGGERDDGHVELKVDKKNICRLGHKDNHGSQ